MLVAQAPRRRLAALPSNAHNKQKTRRVWKRKGGDVCGLKVFCCWHFGRWLCINSDMGFWDFLTLGLLLGM